MDNEKHYESKLCEQCLPCPVCRKRPVGKWVKSYGFPDEFFVSHGLVHYHSRSRETAIRSWNGSVMSYEDLKENWHKMCGWIDVPEELRSASKERLRLFDKCAKFLESLDNLTLETGLRIEGRIIDENGMSVATNVKTDGSMYTMSFDPEVGGR